MKKKSTKKFWYLIAIGISTIILLILLSSILQVGELLFNVHPYVAYAFYGLSAILVYLLIIRPVLIILFSPSFSVTTTLDKNPKKHYRVYRLIAKNMLNNKDIPETAKTKIKESLKDPVELRSSLNHTFNHHIKKKMNKVIINHSKTVMISTAISQNGRLDFITIIVVNIRMIKELVTLCGFRPSFKNLSKLIINVFTTALIAEGLENLNIQDILPTSTMNMLGEIPFIKPIMSSVLQGISNALLTLRIGYVTRKYLFDDSEELTADKIRFGALIEAAKTLPIVIAEGLSIFPKTIFNIFKPKQKNKPKDEAEEQTV